jgi:gamma-glutamylcyclotransferase (GGCT)/AIG2-like uncharacterized protein YtfP
MSFTRMGERDCFIHSTKRGVLQDYKLTFDKKSGKIKDTGFATVSPQQGEDVEGILYELDEKSIYILDKFEGCPKHYTREQKTILTEFGEQMAYVYVATPEWTVEGLKPSRVYLGYLLDGRQYLTESYFNKLKQTETNVG